MNRWATVRCPCRGRIVPIGPDLCVTTGRHASARNGEYGITLLRRNSPRPGHHAPVIPTATPLPAPRDSVRRDARGDTLLPLTYRFEGDLRTPRAASLRATRNLREWPANAPLLPTRISYHTGKVPDNVPLLGTSSAERNSAAIDPQISNAARPTDGRPVLRQGPGTGSFFGPFRPEKCACPLARRGGQSP
jgi:hypothetical protein